jgi:hypothetical protein
MSGFRALGVMVFLYTLYSSYIGEVFAKDKAWGRTIYRAEAAGQFWGIIVCYLGLSLALFFIF